MCRNSVDWLYRLDESYTWSGAPRIDSDRFFFDRKGHLRLVVGADGRITVTAGYAWNGCSPKVCLFDILVGTPDGVVHDVTCRPKTYFASMVHDALYQFLQADLPYTRRQADEIFLRMMAESDFAPRYVYWLAVRVLGGIMRFMISAKRGHDGQGVAAHAFLDERQFA
jgi:hypothetical protein